MTTVPVVLSGRPAQCRLTVPTPDGEMREMQTSGPSVDTFGRVHDDLRISVPDRCNLRCTYRMPGRHRPTTAVAPTSPSDGS
jgi:hypothetical protein